MEHERARDYVLAELPGYASWFQGRLDAGDPEELLMYLDTVSTWLLPDQAAHFGPDDFDAMLDEFRDDAGL
ncbi:hypothetical protein [Massilia sp. CCM 8734]|uniref:hypothetical protein n=1 Tax=Massilia sp. CCM 8734 TaxID=2609283 RepID=UPI001423D9B8|nr:hypothetical protein [Massilia sp. CCM 8734]NHZ94370.1 hypothetical protein [Massilia sp. CCM 8734]